MVIDKNYFLTRLANGEDMDNIGNDIAAMMTEALAEHNAKIEAEKAMAEAAKAEKEAAKRDLIEELIEIVQELAILEGMDPADMKVTEEDVEQLVVAFTEMFSAMRDLKKMFASLEKPAAAPAHMAVKANKIAPTDEQILTDFIKMFN